MILIISCNNKDNNSSGTKTVKVKVDKELIERERIKSLKIKSQIEYDYSYINGNVSSKGYKSSITKYNTDGTMSDLIFFWEDGKIFMSYKYKYNQDKYLIEEIFYENDLDGSITNEKYIYEYDNYGNNILREFYSNNIFEYKIIYKYDINRFCISQTQYDKDGVVENEKNFKPDNNYNDKEQVEYSGSGKIIHTVKYEYDDYGNMISKIKYDSIGNIVESQTKKYLKNGMVIEELHYYKIVGENKYTYKYDDNNNLIERIKYNEYNEPEVRTRVAYEYYQ